MILPLKDIQDFQFFLQITAISQLCIEYSEISSIHVKIVSHFSFIIAGFQLFTPIKYKLLSKDHTHFMSSKSELNFLSQFERKSFFVS
jgi:hypothetical protein